MTPAETWRLDTARLGRRVLVFDCLDSTSNAAAALVREADSDGLVVLADRQTAGRGQHGRHWECPAGVGVLMSVLLFPPPELRRPALLTAWAAVAVCETVRTLMACETRIKWPNDVLLRERKVCGILIETRNVERGAGNAEVAVVAGIGLNVNQTAADLAGLPEATSLRWMAGRSFDPREVARELIFRLDADYDRILHGDTATLEECWRRYLGLQGKPVLAECTDGNHHGRLVRLAWSGLELQGPDGRSIRLHPEAIRHLRFAP